MEVDTHKSEVVLYTPRHVIRGFIALVPGSRLTDYLRSTESFIAVSGATVSSLDGKPLFHTDFLDVARDSIEIAVPAELYEPAG